MINPNSPFKCWKCGRGYTPKNFSKNYSDLYCSRLCRKEARKQRAISRRQKKMEKGDSPNHDQTY